PPTSPTYPLSLHDALPIWPLAARGGSCCSAPMDWAARDSGMFLLAASSASRASEVAPTSRLGDCTARRKAASSSGLTITRSQDRDRKSTRLNSSHVKISYA